jgi:hypothetical protein
MFYIVLRESSVLLIFIGETLFEKVLSVGLTPLIVFLRSFCLLLVFKIGWYFFLGSIKTSA